MKSKPLPTMSRCWGNVWSVRASAMMMWAMWDHNVRDCSWDDVSARQGLLLTTDTIHLNSRGAEIIADLIEGWLYTCAA